MGAFENLSFEAFEEEEKAFENKYIRYIRYSLYCQMLII